MSKIVLLSCTNSKLNHEAPAQELYSASPMFQKTLEYGRSLKPDKMYILSAKHHLVNLTQNLKPYDLTLKDFNKENTKYGLKPGDSMSLRITDHKNIIPLKNNERKKFIKLKNQDFE